MAYNGWKTFNNWNVMLWLQNDYGHYLALEEWLRMKAVEPKDVTYKNLISYMGLEEYATPDRIAYLSSRLNYPELDSHLRQMLAEMKKYLVQ